jgi:tRNA pseudouridine55 synthase
MNGILNILKPSGMTSHDVVAHIRRLTGLRRVGHTGTLDPAAVGVLILLLGKATRLSQYMVDQDKVYRGEITFGIRTDTDDSTGLVLTAETFPEITSQQVEAAFIKFTGSQTQIPPPVSAVKYKGKRLYQWAREEVEVNPSPRDITIKYLDLVDFYPLRENQSATAFFECHCSKGTYMRKLAADIGEYLGCGAHLSFLLRTQVGPFNIKTSHLLEDITVGNIGELLLPLSIGIPHLPQAVIKAEKKEALLNGRPLRVSSLESIPPNIPSGQVVRIEESQGLLLALATWQRDARGGYFQPRQVLHDRG